MDKHMDEKHGHWLLAKMGKTVLRPGGKELTLELMEGLAINEQDSIVEFAPGMGFTASIALKNGPRSYVGIELNQEAAERLREKINGDGREIRIANAANTDLPADTADKVYGEAMLTMQADHRKSEIIAEAHRILKNGGLYGIHELGLTPDDLDSDTKAQIQRELAEVIKVNARPLTRPEWQGLLEKEGFSVEKVMTKPMHLLEPQRLIDDEGFFRAARFGLNVLTNSEARQRIKAMRQVFRKYGDHMNAIALIASKN